jgi:hypothetical protein
MNFRNQVKKYEAEVAAVQAAKERERAIVEWQAEQEKAETLAMLDPAEAKRQRDRCVCVWGGGSTRVVMMSGWPVGGWVVCGWERWLRGGQASVQSRCGCSAGGQGGWMCG